MFCLCDELLNLVDWINLIIEIGRYKRRSNDNKKVIFSFLIYSKQKFFISNQFICWCGWYHIEMVNKRNGNWLSLVTWVSNSFLCWLSNVGMVIRAESRLAVWLYFYRMFRSRRNPLPVCHSDFQSRLVSSANASSRPWIPFQSWFCHSPQILSLEL